MFNHAHVSHFVLAAADVIHLPSFVRRIAARTAMTETSGLLIYLFIYLFIYLLFHLVK